VKTNEHAESTFYLEAIYGVRPETHENLRTAPAARDELQSWLESLNAEVHAVTVRPADAAGEE
jgi:hypothetical protein